MKFLLPLFALLFVFSGCGLNKDSESSENTKSIESSENTEVSETPKNNITSSLSSSMDFSQTAPAQKGDTVAVLSTNYGDITLRLFSDLAPKTVENFSTHAKEGYYNGVLFHRIIDGFMIQGGDPEGTGMGGESIWGKPFADEFHKDLSNIRGSLSMANAGPGTNGSQFFINQAENTFLDNRHTVFGQVVEGMEVVDTIAKLPKDANDRPLKDVVITGIVISVFGE